MQLLIYLQISLFFHQCIPYFCSGPMTCYKFLNHYFTVILKYFLLFFLTLVCSEFCDQWQLTVRLIVLWLRLHHLRIKLKPWPYKIVVDSYYITYIHFWGFKLINGSFICLALEFWKMRNIIFFSEIVLHSLVLSS